MNNYICGPTIEASNGTEAIIQVTPVYKLLSEIAVSESVVCIPRESVGIGLVSGGFIGCMVIFSVLGYFAGRSSSLFPKYNKTK